MQVDDRNSTGIDAIEHATQCLKKRLLVSDFSAESNAPTDAPGREPTR